jgi:hypothetical protein
LSSSKKNQEIKQEIQTEFHEIISKKQKLQIDEINLDFEGKISTIKKEIDALQIEVMQPKIWYKDASVIISVLALVFSFGVSFASYLQVDNQNKRALRAELRGLVQRLITLPKEFAEIRNTYKNDPYTFSTLGSNLSTEYHFLANQSVELSTKIPYDITAAEYISIAQALINQGLLSQVPIILDAGLKVSKDPISELALVRLQATYLFKTGNISDGRKKFQETKRIFNKYQLDQTSIEYSNVTNLIVLADNEYSQGQCKEAEKNLNMAYNKNVKLLKSVNTNLFEGQIKTARELIIKNRKLCKN